MKEAMPKLKAEIDAFFTDIRDDFSSDDEDSMNFRDPISYWEKK